MKVKARPALPDLKGADPRIGPKVLPTAPVTPHTKYPEPNLQSLSLGLQLQIQTPQLPQPEPLK